MRTIDLSVAAWRKSSYSNADGGQCVEVAADFPGAVPVRDSKAADGPALIFGSAPWSTFVGAVRSGEFSA
ncbi:DUF397 domain-containing protein [Streptomyces sp. NA04227]|uniref:DUF397 domain-containing protein n=1 Tax=Streptomyces sp. NA04227 TaxID=2742136 RepID=UPI001590C4C9|nr:DUF397 domain-containing protein [Streptomyces sp. NA04227]QKW06369.1 DUF397 domain-containing protein [Streptomyces sp. NA04227]